MPSSPKLDQIVHQPAYDRWIATAKHEASEGRFSAAANILSNAGALQRAYRLTKAPYVDYAVASWQRAQWVALSGNPDRLEVELGLTPSATYRLPLEWLAAQAGLRVKTEHVSALLSMSENLDWFKVTGRVRFRDEAVACAAAAKVSLDALQGDAVRLASKGFRRASAAKIGQILMRLAWLRPDLVPVSRAFKESMAQVRRMPDPQSALDVGNEGFAAVRAALATP